jgi:hypothetical protein
VVTGGQVIGTGADHQGGPSLACSDSGVCLAVGFTSGIPLGFPGGTWARLFNASDLSPRSDLFYLDDHAARLDEQQVIYNPFSKKFSVLWARQADGGWIDFRQVSLDGTLGPLDYSRSFGPGAGDVALSYNKGTGTSLLTTKYLGGSDLYALQIGDDGNPIDFNNAIMITPWDGQTLAYWNSTASNASNRQWLVAYAGAAGWKVQLVGWSP